MKEMSTRRLGGICAVLVGVSYVLIGGIYVMLSKNLQSSNPTRFYPAFVGNPTLITIQYWAFALGALLAIGAVQAISESVRPQGEGWTRWTGQLAFLGFVVTAIDNFRLIAIQPIRAAAYVGGDSATREVIARTASLLMLDPDGWLGFGCVGLWVLVASLLMLRGRVFPKPLAYIGVAVTVLYWLVVTGLVLGGETGSTMISVAAALGGVIAAPIWYIWTGIRLQHGGS